MLNCNENSAVTKLRIYSKRKVALNMHGKPYTAVSNYIERARQPSILSSNKRKSKSFSDTIPYITEYTVLSKIAAQAIRLCVTETEPSRASYSIHLSLRVGKVHRRTYDMASAWQDSAKEKPEVVTMSLPLLSALTV